MCLLPVLDNQGRYIGHANAPTEVDCGDTVNIPLRHSIKPYLGDLADKSFDPFESEREMSTQTVNVTTIVKGGRIWLEARPKVAEQLRKHIASGGNIS